MSRSRSLLLISTGLLAFASARPAAAEELRFRPTLLARATLPQRAGGEALSNGTSNRHLSSIGLSLLLPGSAQLKAGRTGRGLLFLGAEGAIWTAFAAFRVQGGLRRDSYLEMARLFAGVEHPEGRDDDYYRLLGLISSSDVYDIVVRSDARRFYPDDLEAREAYVAEHRIPNDRAWQWESDAARERYRAKRNDSQSAYRASRNMIGLAVVNRLAAMFDAVLAERDGGSATHLRLVPGGERGTACLAITRELP